MQLKIRFHDSSSSLIQRFATFFLDSYFIALSLSLSLSLSINLLCFGLYIFTYKIWYLTYTTNNQISILHIMVLINFFPIWLCSLSLIMLGTTSSKKTMSVWLKLRSLYIVRKKVSIITMDLLYFLSLIKISHKNNLRFIIIEKYF